MKGMNQNPEDRMIKLRTAFIFILTPGFWTLFFFIPLLLPLVPSLL